MQGKKDACSYANTSRLAELNAMREAHEPAKLWRSLKRSWK